MQPLLLKKNTRSYSQSFYIGKHRVNYTFDVWHHHEELEFLHILNGKGTRFIGDNVEPFDSGDLVLVGSNLPHVWKSDKTHYENNPQICTKLILTQFVKDFVSTDFLNLPEMKGVRELLDDSIQGLQILGRTRDVVSKRLLRLADQDGGDKLIGFVQVLLFISKTKEYRKLSSLGYVNAYKSQGADRISRVQDYIMNNFTEEITLKEAADVIHMNETSFCRFFKNTTLKTFTQYLNEVRVGYACKLLLHNKDLDIANISYKSGFKNVSYFNKVFKDSHGLTPLNYKKKYST